MTDLLPCPFCGATPDINSPNTFQSNQGDKWGYVVCCCNGPEVRTDHKPVDHWRDAAIAAWNTRATGWQDIATARRDGTRVLVFDTDISVAWWEPNLEIIMVDDPDYKKAWRMDYEIKYRGGWTSGVVESFAYETTQKLNPTHWQPLPKPPEE